MSQTAPLAIVSAPFKILKSLFLLNPLVTGPLLYVLVKGPDHVRDTLLQTVRVDAIAAQLNTSSSVVVETSIKALKWLVALGTVAKVNNFLNNLALNHWSLTPKGAGYNWKAGKEIICITGGSSGFGALMVKGFVEKVNARIVVIDVQDLPKDLSSLANVTFYKCDLTQPKQVAEVTDRIKKEVGNPTILINNAGIGRSGLIIDATPEWIEKIFRVNVMSHWLTVAAFLPAMLEAKKGHVVTMASMATFVSVANIADYSATKAGLLAFHEGLNQELKHRYTNGRYIQTTVIHPLFAKTPLVTTGMASSGAGKKHESELLPPEAISDRVVKSILTGRSAQIFVPDDAERVSGIRGWPHWMQELARDSSAKITKGDP